MSYAKRTVFNGSSAFLIFAACFFGTWALAQDLDRPVIESIDGDKIVVIKTPSGHRVGQRGTEVNIGDIIKTGPRASVKIKYPDGSKLLIGKGTEVEVGESKNGIQTNQLNSGEVRGLIKKPKGLKKAGGPPRFIVRSRSAVMGVRGTDFVFNVDGSAAKSELFTLEGSVQVAKTEAELMQGQGVLVQRNEFITADTDGVNAPKAFDRELFQAHLSENQPTFISFVNSDPEIREAQKSNESLDQALRDDVSQNAPKKDEDSWKFFELLQFRLASMYVRQKTGGDVFTGQLSWNPAVNVFNILSVRLHAGIFPLKSRTLDKTIRGYELGILGSIPLLNPLLLEAGIGGQEWGTGDQSDGGPIVMGTVGWKFGQSKYLERVFLGVTYYRGRTTLSQPNEMGSGYYYTRVDNPALQIKAGVGIQF